MREVNSFGSFGLFGSRRARSECCTVQYVSITQFGEKTEVSCLIMDGGFSSSVISYRCWLNVTHSRSAPTKRAQLSGLNISKSCFTSNQRIYVTPVHHYTTVCTITSIEHHHINDVCTQKITGKVFIYSKGDRLVLTYFSWCGWLVVCAALTPLSNVLNQLSGLKMFSSSYTK